MKRRENDSEMRNKILRRRYFLKDAQGKVIENEEQMLRRVANVIAAAESKYGCRSHSFSFGSSPPRSPSMNQHKVGSRMAENSMAGRKEAHHIRIDVEHLTEVCFFKGLRRIYTFNWSSGKIRSVAILEITLFSPKYVCYFCLTNGFLIRHSAYKPNNNNDL
jgi:ribonucleotide reductase alpha subunit